MILSREPADQAIVVLAQKRCLAAGNARIPGGFAQWAINHWPQFTSHTKIELMRDAIASVIDSPSEEYEWERYVSVALQQMSVMERRDLHQSLTQDGKATMDRLFTSCGKCGYAHHLCLCGGTE